ncbi:hypothetical protein FWD20_00600 [Candidatus Saccharibacteria bacterium]|nr:hypothetical protein [Candidatus Saccharibacteria bacterium]
MNDFREIFGALTVVLSALVYVPLIISTIKGKLKPHPVTWFIQVLVLGTGGMILLFNGAHAGSWGYLVSTTFCLVVTILSFFNYRKSSKFSRADIVFLLLALAALVLWLLSRDLAVISVILLAAASALGFVPTITKTWRDPRSESLYTWVVFFLIVTFGIAATENFDFVNIFGRAVGAFVSVLLIFIMIFRRRKKRYM